MERKKAFKLAFLVAGIAFVFISIVPGINFVYLALGCCLLAIGYNYGKGS